MPQKVNRSKLVTLGLLNVNGSKVSSLDLLSNGSKMESLEPFTKKVTNIKKNKKYLQNVRKLEK